MFFPKQLPDAFHREVQKVQKKLMEKEEKVTTENVKKSLEIKKGKTRPTLKSN